MMVLKITFVYYVMILVLLTILNIIQLQRMFHNILLIFWKKIINDEELILTCESAKIVILIIYIILWK